MKCFCVHPLYVPIQSMLPVHRETVTFTVRNPYHYNLTDFRISFYEPEWCNFNKPLEFNFVIGKREIITNI